MDYKDKKTFIMPVGLPGSGKSTWIRAFIEKTRQADNWVIIGTDTIVNDWAIRDGILLENGNVDYNTAFDSYNVKDIQREVRSRLTQAVIEGKSIIFDQTNMAPKARGRQMRLLSDDYQKEAVVFVVPENVLKERRNNPDRLTGQNKTVPEFILRNMANSYVTPNKAEGFNKITYVRD